MMESIDQINLIEPNIVNLFEIYEKVGKGEFLASIIVLA